MLLKQFWESIDKKTNEECWEWIKGKTSKGYGTVRYENKTYLAHRLAYQLFHNKTLDKLIFICHKCDNPLCCNPNHLFQGTNKDNIDDKVNKNRQTKGETNANVKLTSEQVISIRTTYENRNITHRQLASIYNVTSPTITAILKRKTWKHI